MSDDAHEMQYELDKRTNELRGVNMYVYVRSETSVWTVGFYAPSGKWVPESDHTTAESAAKRVAYLNGAG